MVAAACELLTMTEALCCYGATGVNVRQDAPQPMGSQGRRVIDAAFGP